MRGPYFQLHPFIGLGYHALHSLCLGQVWSGKLISVAFELSEKALGSVVATMSRFFDFELEIDEQLQIIAYIFSAVGLIGGKTVFAVYVLEFICAGFPAGYGKKDDFFM